MIPATVNAGELLTKVTRVLKKMNLPRGLDSESLAQDIFIEAWLKSNPITNQLIRHRAISRIRLLKHHIEILEETYPEESESLSLSSINDELKSLLSQAHLTYNEIQIIFLRFWKDQTQDQIAATLAIPLSHVSAQLTDILARLRRIERITSAKESQE